MEPGYASQLRAEPVAPVLHAVPYSELSLPPVDSTAVDAVRALNARPGLKALQIGLPRDFAPSPASSLAWRRIDGEWVAQWRVTSPGAAGLRVALRVSQADDAATAVFAGESGEAYGPFHPATADGSPYWSPVVEGETLTVELRSASAAPPLGVSLVAVSHLIASPRQADIESLLKAGSGTCEVDLVCRSASDNALAAAGTSVARMLFNEGTSSFLCTGTLLNSYGGTFAPYFYSAAHCISDQASASSLVTYWFYQASTCGGNAGPMTQLTGGATLLYADPGVSDVSFMRLNAAPPSGAQFAGWDASTLSPGTAVTGIHHPAGDQKKVSLGTVRALGKVPSQLANSGSFIDLTWSSGVTEGGSSGSGLFTAANGTYYHRGGLLGGGSACGQYQGADDYYSRFDLAYPALKAWLGSPPPPVPPQALAVTVAGAGAGRVSSSPAAISCGSTCTAQFNAGTAVTLTAVTGIGSAFSGWSGDCGGTGACTVTMSAARNVTATFAPLAPGMSLSATSLTFPGGQLVGTRSPLQPIVVTNTGRGILSVQDVTVAGPFEITNDCASVAPGGTCSIFVTFVPAAAAEASGSLAITGTAGSATVSLAGTGRLSLVDGFYQSIFGRPADAGGKAFWEQQAYDLAAAGGNINEAWYAMAITFFNSPEYLAYNRDDSQFLTDLYATFFQRAPDPGGLQFWLGLIQGGLPRNVVLVSFLFSPEFANFTQSLYGNTAARPEMDVVMDFYRGLLSRMPDAGGLAFWVQRFKVAQCLGPGPVANEVEAISSAFAQGAEYAARNRPTVEYVSDLYNAFMRRGGDAAGVEYYRSNIDSGVFTREQVRRQFIASPEFQARVNAIVGAGCTALARRLVGGTWTFDAVFNGTPLTTTYTLASVPVVASQPPESWIATGLGGTGGQVTGSYSSASQLWTVRAPSVGADVLYVFGFDSDNRVTGCYYQVPPGGAPSGACNAMSGRR